MSVLARARPHRVLRLSSTRLATRSFAEVVSTTASSKTSSHLERTHPVLNYSTASTPGGVIPKGRISVREDHGLYGFFRRKDVKGDVELVGDARFEVVEAPEKMQRVTGRGWKASELRLKSFEDLHTLWYVLLRERNLLATQKEEARRMGVTNTESQVSLERVHHCRKSMARIKAVINERRLAYEGAVKLANEQREEHYDKVVMKHQAAYVNTEREYLRRRRELMERRREARKQKREVEQKAQLPQEGNKGDSSLHANESGSSVDVELLVSEDLKTTSPEVSVQTKEPILTRVDASQERGLVGDTKREMEQETISENSEKKQQHVLPKTTERQKEGVKPEVSRPKPTSTKPVDTAAAGLFGDVEVAKGKGRS